ncbi:uncharacterized protein BJ171DRAFT_517823 [Polychytrium aggregatum]|uniref:uncharacterized protein n=1 Tax=Polychytrium aggregatum TaxID=110093 RepID=UPI0022FECF40|nr:uncharacterized protein BJ171DRAFT_517823 [Polychytrium aggregatum]KAI9199523.1 hypothetical protein BJ171DRAFT_517823 [Polychytrium aggregatum]
MTETKYTSLSGRVRLTKNYQSLLLLACVVIFVVLFSVFTLSGASTGSSAAQVTAPKSLYAETGPYVCEHHYTAKILVHEPLVMRIDNFLSYREADHIVELARPRFQRSPVASSNGDSVHEARTSSTAFLGKSHDDVIACVEERASMLTSFPVNHIESLQVVHYAKGQRYLPHYDYFAKSDPEAYKKYTANGGQRVITIFGYLNEISSNPPEEWIAEKEKEGANITELIAKGTGGHTFFPELKLSVYPKKGSAVLFFDMNGKGEEDPMTLHGGMPPEWGEKFGLNVWIRQREIV